MAVYLYVYDTNKCDVRPMLGPDIADNFKFVDLSSTLRKFIKYIYLGERIEGDISYRRSPKKI